MEEKEYQNVVTSLVNVVGVTRLSFTDKDTGEEIKGISIYYTKPQKENKYNKDNIRGHKISPKDFKGFIKDISRWDELTYNNFPYQAELLQEFIEDGKPLKFIDIKVIN
ncbi:MAG: hypothetical protein PHX62_03685 [Bacilli bacterium]|nr:hypothetical protein [Bacilli bacterium]